MTFPLTEEESEKRLDLALTERFKEHSRSYFHYLFEKGAVLANGRVVKKREKLPAGTEISVDFLETAEISLDPEPIPLDILFEDEHLIAVNKPVGMVVHPAPGNPSGTFVNALLYHCKTLERDAGDLRPGIVHRLDKETSGLLIAAKTRKAHQKLVAQFSDRKVKKSYLAICVGRPKEGLFSAPISRHPVRRKEMAVLENGKEAISEFEVLAYRDNSSLVKVNLITGRTHQIRVHLKALNCPLIGDTIYGCPEGAKRPLLHAHEMQLSHPVTGESIDLLAPVPEDFEKEKFCRFLS